MTKAKPKPSNNLWIEKEIDLIVQKATTSFTNTIGQIRAQTQKEQKGAKHLETAALTLMQMPQTDKRDLVLMEIAKAMAILSDQSSPEPLVIATKQNKAPTATTKALSKRRPSRKKRPTKTVSTKAKNGPSDKPGTKPKPMEVGAHVIEHPKYEVPNLKMSHTPLDYQGQFV